MHILSGSRTTNAAAVNFTAASNFLRLAKSVEDGSFYSAMASVTFAAFTHEAFLNMLCEQNLAIDDWQRLNHGSWKKKHEALFSKLQIVTNFSVEPESILVQIFEFRNRIAHGCKETTSFKEIPVQELSPLT